MSSGSNAYAGVNAGRQSRAAKAGKGKKSAAKKRQPYKPLIKDGYF